LNIVGSLDQSMDVHPDIPVRKPVNNLSLVERIDNGGQRDRKQRNIVFIILESTRAQSTTIHNPDLETTPFLAKLAADSVVAKDAYAVVPHTSKALVAILCGIEPHLTMRITEALPGGIPTPCLGNLL